MKHMWQVASKPKGSNVMLANQNTQGRKVQAELFDNDIILGNIIGILSQDLRTAARSMRVCKKWHLEMKRQLLASFRQTDAGWTTIRIGADTSHFRCGGLSVNDDLDGTLNLFFHLDVDATSDAFHKQTPTLTSFHWKILLAQNPMLSWLSQHRSFAEGVLPSLNQNYAMLQTMPLIEPFIDSITPREEPHGKELMDVGVLVEKSNAKNRIPAEFLWVHGRRGRILLFVEIKHATPLQALSWTKAKHFELA